MLAMNPSSPDAKPLQLVPLKKRLTNAVAKEHAFLREVDELADVTYDEDVIRVAALRYERLWIPAVAALTTQGLPVPSPPLDIAYIWHCHVLCPTRYFSDWEHLAGTVPDFVFPGARNKLPEDSLRGLNAKVDLTSKASALESMWRSLGDDVEAANATDLEQAVKAQPASQLSYDVAAAALRQRSFFYQVSLPHYRAAGFIRQAVNRYITFLGLRQVNPGVKLCPTYDIDLVWHSHMSLPHQYKADTEALLGMHLPHDDSITDRSDGSALQDVQRTTERLFEEAGEQFFQAGGMFRGIPTRLTPAQREACSPEAPPSSVKLSLKYVEWKPSSDGGASEALLHDRRITAWSFRKGSGDGSFWRRSRNSKHMQPAAEALEATSAAPHTLRIRVEEHASKSLSKSVSTASVVINLGIMLQSCGTTDSQQQVEVLVPVGRKAGRCTAVLTLQLTKLFRSVACRGPRTLNGWARASDQPLSPWVQSSAAYVNAEHASAAGHVSQPELLLPVSAVNDKGNDAAETRSFLMPVQGGMCKDSFAGAPLLARITNTSKHLATAIEIFSTTADHGSDTAAVPAATAHSITLSTLPLMSPEVSFRGLMLSTYCATRAFLIRSADKDWGVLLVWWSKDGPGPCRADSQLFVLDGHYSSWQRGLNGVSFVFKGSLQTTLHVRSHGAFQALKDFGDSKLSSSAKEAGRLAAVAAAVSLCRSLLLVMAMPCSLSVRSPQDVPSLDQARRADNLDDYGPLFASHQLPNPPVRMCKHLPTNGYIAKRLYALRTGKLNRQQSRNALLLWYGTKDAALAPWREHRFWGGPEFSHAKMVQRRKAWAAAAAAKKEASEERGGDGGPVCGGCAAACGAGSGCTFEAPAAVCG